MGTRKEHGFSVWRAQGLISRLHDCTTNVSTSLLMHPALRELCYSFSLSLCFFHIFCESMGGCICRGCCQPRGLRDSGKLFLQRNTVGKGHNAKGDSTSRGSGRSPACPSKRHISLPPAIHRTSIGCFVFQFWVMASMLADFTVPIVLNNQSIETVKLYRSMTPS